MEDFRSKWERKYHFAHNIYMDTQKLLLAQDAKAGVVLTINCFIIGVLSDEFPLGKKILLDPGNEKSIKIIFIGLCLLFLFLLVRSTLNSFSTFFPRLKVEDDADYNIKRLIFCGHIIEKESPEDYLNQVLESQDSDLLIELTTQIWLVSSIFRQKFTNCKRALESMYWSLLFAILLTAFIEVSRIFD